MGKAFGILLIAAAAWVGMEIYTEGSSNAFGGVFASLLGTEAPADAEAHRSTAQRAGGAVERAHRETEARYDQMLDD